MQNSRFNIEYPVRVQSLLIKRAAAKKEEIQIYFSSKEECEKKAISARAALENKPDMSGLTDIKKQLKLAKRQVKLAQIAVSLNLNFSFRIFLLFTHNCWWCSGFLLGFLRRRSGVRFPYPPVLEKCAKGFAYAIFFG